VSYSGPTFSLPNRLLRFAWLVCWTVAFRLSPVPFHRYRVLLLRLFGARVSMSACVYPSVRIWAPWHLAMGPHSALGPRVTCYNIAMVTLGEYAIVSQGAHLCTGSHDFDDPIFPLYALPISLERHAWACADTFVGPGVTLRQGAVLGACGVAFRDLPPWTVAAGNPARQLRLRRQCRASDQRPR
jgi:putative colanic acid biosynthesis acetyltransferase WcaF